MDAASTPGARKQPSQERSRQTVAAVLEAAAQVFSSVGYGAATTARIAERAGVSVGSLYQFFSNKEALLVALGERHVERTHARLERALDDEALVGAPLQVLIRKLVTAMLELHLEEPALHRLLFQEIPRQPIITRAKQASEQALLARFERLLRGHPEVHVRSPPLAAALAGQVLESLTHWWVLDGPGPDGDRGAFTGEVTTLICAYLGGTSSD